MGSRTTPFVHNYLAHDFSRSISCPTEVLSSFIYTLKVNDEMSFPCDQYGNIHSNSKFRYKTHLRSPHNID
ncbi:hypothetical protein Y032_0189g1191 [Ancylostoma ceylanicum]|uniref:Uncharacterized protein n=1 Tax=Ancylostoma ceylanicum TaxID=53326 RepID=A0A016SRA1_9BILA|nr:hypothetical protein Y032_0189g1191 [Ancylostoma ceylanicum]